MLLILIALASGCVEPQVAAELACAQDGDCAPAACCHPASCVNTAFKPNCTGIGCTAVCEPGTMDCGQGYCACVRGQCEAVIEE